MPVKYTYGIYCILLTTVLVVIKAANLLDFCEYQNKLVDSNLGLVIPILRSRISSGTFDDFLRNNTFRELFEKKFCDKINDDHIEWDNDIDHVYMVVLSHFTPTTLGCIYKRGYHIKALSNKTTIEIPDLVKAISDETYKKLMNDKIKDNDLPVIVLQGSSPLKSVFCVFGTMYATHHAYFIMQCLFEPATGNEIPKFIKIMEKIECNAKPSNDQVLCFSHFPNYCDSDIEVKHKLNVSSEFEARSGISNGAASSSGTHDTINITNVPNSWEQLFRRFYCSNCTINININDKSSN